LPPLVGIPWLPTDSRCTASVPAVLPSSFTVNGHLVEQQQRVDGSDSYVIAHALPPGMQKQWST